MSGKKIAVLGTGANGAGIGADLTRAGLDVTFIEQWPAHVEAMRANGLRVEMPDESTHTEVNALHLCEVATLRDKFDIVFVVVKAYDTRWVCELIKPLLHERSLVVGLQNGMSIDDMMDVVGPERTIGAVIEVASNMFNPGTVVRQTPPAGSWFAVGSLHPSTRGREHEVVEVLQHAGTVEVSADIRSSKWMKLVANAGELVPTAILNLPMADAAALPGMREFMDRNCQEALRVSLAIGNRATPIFGLAEITTPDPDAYAIELLDLVHSKWTLPDTLTTVLQDWRKGRRGEVNEVNGLVVREGARVGVPTPANQRTLELAARIEAGELEARPENLELLLA
ncbi:2-dehydropantoate 2-reductase [Cryobacterium sp. BB307]|uniref:ketopantoate reductase family protein n=1 Tax=Cryobacterium sp. BB307 TaxID=2716317 RepID=UPI0014457FEE|nr:2-dehydropantoate 2-reductase [Cryobacterium sp. BB307]